MSEWNGLDELWRERHVAARLDEFARVLEAMDETSGEGWWRRARLDHFRAMQAETESDTKRAGALFSSGAQWAEQAIEALPHRVETSFWRGVNLLEAARCDNFLARWRTLKPAEALIARAEATDEQYHFAGPLRVHARITHRKPLLLGGSIEMALLFFQHALQIAPHNSTTLFYYAEALLDDRQRLSARDVLSRIADAPDDAEWRWEQERDRHRARALLEETEE